MSAVGKINMRRGSNDRSRTNESTQELGINTIRSYNVDPTLNHDECASIFNSVGIYMLLDVNSPLSGQSLDRSRPRTSYNLNYLNHIFSVVEAFKDYPNTLGFFAGNEIINDLRTAGPNPPYIRAVTRDLKQYIAAHASRTIPVVSRVDGVACAPIHR